MSGDLPKPAGGRTVMVSSVASDAHSWNLVYLQLLIEELGHTVINLGPCVPDDLLIDECARLRPDLLVISTVNGHGYQDGMRVVRKLRDLPGLAATPMVIGGKVGISGGESPERVAALLEAGFDAVFQEGGHAVGAFRDFIGTLTERVAQ
ncbi:cobalamin B12-binding domain-containing protein [Streptomyces sp. NPDC058155]|uniref:cobalamin B12-binding domain-containing protein n=1 Tax=Streptomyces sp. NPDC058155 TaxID=3346359 RepID=UPI0036F0B4B1